MNTIHRLKFRVADEVTFDVPGFWRPLHIEKLSNFKGDFYAELWYEVHTEGPPRTVSIYAKGTGHPNEFVLDSAQCKYVSTLIWPGDFMRLVFHFYVGWTA